MREERPTAGEVELDVSVFLRNILRKLPYIVVLIDPCTGGVSASLAMLGTIQIAEPNALIGFAGPRTIKATIRLELPEGFQSSEFLLKHGYIDRIVRRPNLKSEIARTIDYCGK